MICIDTLTDSDRQQFLGPGPSSSGICQLELSKTEIMFFHFESPESNLLQSKLINRHCHSAEGPKTSYRTQPLQALTRWTGKCPAWWRSCPSIICSKPSSCRTVIQRNPQDQFGETISAQLNFRENRMMHLDFVDWIVCQFSGLKHIECSIIPKRFSAKRRIRGVVTNNY